jgi:SAM-dependent methyltransferase
MTDPRGRFSNRVEDYRRYRPGYPAGVIRTLEQAGALSRDGTVADVGSGTGILTGLLLAAAQTVYAIEPNAPMRHAAEEELGTYPGFRSVDATAEATTLPDASVDLVTAGQAFHWFDPAAARREFLRILHSGGQVALVWNERLTDTPFLDAFENLLLRHSVDYTTVDHRQVTPDTLAPFFGPGGYRSAVFPNEQRFDREGLRGRLLSSSYVPPADHPGFPAMIEEMERIFAAHQEGGRVAFRYETKLFWGPLTGSTASLRG